MAIGPNGVPYLSYTDNTSANLRVCNYVSSWTCTNVDDDGSYFVKNGSIAFSPSGTPYVAYQDNGNAAIKITQLKEAVQIPSTDITVRYDGASGGITGDLRYRLASGTSPYSHDFGAGCNGVNGYMGYCGLFHPDSAYDSLQVNVGERPMYSMSTSFNSSNILPTATVDFRTGASPATDTVYLQVYRFGSTNAWENIATYTSAGCSSSNCRLSGVPTGTPSDYFSYDKDRSMYDVYFRVYQDDAASGFTFEMDSFTALQANQTLRSGQTFRDQDADPLRW